MAHPLAKLVLAVPICQHSRARPRGYAGDAALLDYLYGIEPHAEPGDESRIAQVSKFLFQSRASAAVRARREVLAKLVDEVGARVTAPRALSVACGHLREASLSEAIRSRRYDEFVALDQDAESLAVVERNHGGHGVRAVRGSVRGILAGRHQHCGLDLVYAAGLYDYLSAKVAARLTARLFGMLRSGGELLVANFARGIPDAGFMECFMDWNLIYRDRQEVLDLTREIPDEEIAQTRVHADRTGSLLFLHLTRR